jgi:hypothetical protein
VLVKFSHAGDNPLKHYNVTLALQVESLESASFFESCMYAHAVFTLNEHVFVRNSMFWNTLMQCCCDPTTDSLAKHMMYMSAVLLK